MKQCTICLEYQGTQPQETALHHEIPYMPWEIVDTDILVVNNKTLLCIANDSSEFPIVKKVVDLSADDIVHTTKLIFAEFGVNRTNISDAGMNFMSEMYKRFCRKIKHQTVYNILLSLPEQWSSRSMH